MKRYEPSHPDLHCLHRYVLMCRAEKATPPVRHWLHYCYLKPCLGGQCFFNCTPVGRVQTLWWPRLQNYSFRWSGPDMAYRGSTGGFLLLHYSSGGVWHRRYIAPYISTRCCCCWFLIFALIYELSVIYLLPVMIHGSVRRPPRVPNKHMYMFWFCFTILEAESAVWDPVNLD